ncbi:hypothetical protein AN189_18105 [Loktanella sp. 3ANDIMAR09]|uniref:hypothetical protein n=1 Tax=Loktanella sp. 3ANDIMAR09 TaxID=1225657 RepID=UPI0006F97DC9|nr:hypothetical protein [Loktanella sp. 3ANDIMAR09]KQI66969.1 hypothetical protein AN189_18105 [Loktanella sp. 3ANDIMAR09]
MRGWLDAGRDYALFWTLTPREIVLILQGHNNMRAAENEVARIRNYELAGLIVAAYHKPQKMPRYKPIKVAPVDDAAADAQLEAWLISISETADT